MKINILNLKDFPKDWLEIKKFALKKPHKNHTLKRFHTDKEIEEEILMDWVEKYQFGQAALLTFLKDNSKMGRLMGSLDGCRQMETASLDVGKMA